jgi:hypothetical protein
VLIYLFVQILLYVLLFHSSCLSSGCALHGSPPQAQQRVVADLSAKVTTLTEARRWEADALERAFRGAAGDGRENELEQQLAAIVPRLDQVPFILRRWRWPLAD